MLFTRRAYAMPIAGGPVLFHLPARSYASPSTCHAAPAVFAFFFLRLTETEYDVEDIDDYNIPVLPLRARARESAPPRATTDDNDMREMPALLLLKAPEQHGGSPQCARESAAVRRVSSSACARAAAECARARVKALSMTLIMRHER